jgi:uncharacterized membrane protein
VLTFIAALVWVTTLVAAPRAAASATTSARVMSAIAYAAGSLVCHQRPERSFHVGAAQLPVCARCLGVYAGTLLGVALWVAIAGLRALPRARAARWIETSRLRLLLLFAALPTVGSVASASLGWWDGSNATRALLALPLGAAIGAVVTAYLAKDLR